MYDHNWQYMERTWEDFDDRISKESPQEEKSEIKSLCEQTLEWRESGVAYAKRASRVNTPTNAGSSS